MKSEEPSNVDFYTFTSTVGEKKAVTCHDDDSTSPHAQHYASLHSITLFFIVALVYFSGCYASRAVY